MAKLSYKNSSRYSNSAESQLTADKLMLLAYWIYAFIILRLYAAESNNLNCSLESGQPSK